jgi:ABC-type multidrug transport system fused ATPase/permease subunit
MFLGLYVAFIVFFTFHIILFVTYLFIVFVSTIVFTAYYIKLQTYYCKKRVKVSKTLNEELKLNLKDIEQNQLPYFVFEKHTKEKVLKMIVKASDANQIFEVVAYDHTFACVKDSTGNEYITYLNYLELA